MAKLTPFAAPLVALALPLLTACAVGPNFRKPAAPQVSDYTSQPVSTTVAAPGVLAGQAQHFNPGDRLEWQRNVHIVMSGLRIVHALPVHQHQGLAKGAAADREVGLHAVGGPLLQVERRIQPQEIHPSIGE